MVTTKSANYVDVAGVTHELFNGVGLKCMHKELINVCYTYIVRKVYES